MSNSDARKRLAESIARLEVPRGDEAEDVRASLHALWREAAEKGIERGIDWPRVVLDLFRALDEAAADRAEQRRLGAEVALLEVAAHGVALDKGSGIVCLCGEICNAVTKKSPARLVGTTSDYYEAVNAGTVFAQHLREVRARAAAKQVSER
jgi:hypothetical protein